MYFEFRVSSLDKLNEEFSKSNADKILSKEPTCGKGYEFCKIYSWNWLSLGNESRLYCYEDTMKCKDDVIY